MTLLYILQKADLSFFSSKKLKAITNGTFLLQQLEYSQKPFGNACCICKKIYFFNHVLCSKWGQVMFNVASQFTAYPKINSNFQILGTYGQSIFCVPHSLIYSFIGCL